MHNSNISNIKNSLLLFLLFIIFQYSFVHAQITEWTPNQILSPDPGVTLYSAAIEANFYVTISSDDPDPAMVPPTDYQIVCRDLRSKKVLWQKVLERGLNTSFFELSNNKILVQVWDSLFLL